MKFWKIILVTIFSFALFSCANKYQAPQDIQTPLTNLTKAQVKTAILSAGTQGTSSLGTWKMKEINQDLIRASLFNRGYEVTVNIPYSAKGYSIKYVSASSNLKDANGNLHRNYNRWINNLDLKIRQKAFSM